MNDRRTELKIAAGLLIAFAVAYFLPVGQPRFDRAVGEALALTQWYAQEHVVLCLLPAFWIAGAIAAFVSQSSVMRYLGPRAPKPLAYGVGAVSGTILAVCSCTILPLFAGIYRMGAGLGPATAFLFSGPAINALAIILTAKVLGVQLGAARAVGAVAFSVVIGLLMALIFRREERAKAAAAVALPEDATDRSLWKTTAFFAVMVAILVFANWGAAGEGSLFGTIHAFKWWLTGAATLAFGHILWRWMGIPGQRLLLGAAAVAAAGALTGSPTWTMFAGVIALAWITAGQDGEAGEWFEQTWTYTKQILPLLLGGVLVAGMLLGRPGAEGLVPAEWISAAVGGNSLAANLFSSGAGSLMYFATLTEIPILQGLRGSGMGEGPSLALLLAGPALSLPSMLVINAVIGPRKTAVYVTLVVIMATLTGWAYGTFTQIL
jgi:uncharacterized protein